MGEIIQVILYQRSSWMINLFPSAFPLTCIHAFCKTYAMVVITIYIIFITCSLL